MFDDGSLHLVEIAGRSQIQEIENLRKIHQHNFSSLLQAGYSPTVGLKTDEQSIQLDSSSEYIPTDESEVISVSPKGKVKFKRVTIFFLSIAWAVYLVHFN
ncbi:hypothetical protein Glove_48g50 [Diversispora epigaea]|uniref:Uncharacterized protein n=1 Tax=Diversispora epigaea TaxID=1348612 RepID=A0A397JE88_9GLOM|nr:hypothetical protein Glove_48g50 [Diversispora epigaea]